jgi:hypothetical protein
MNVLSTVSTVAGAAKLLAPPPPAPTGQTFIVRAPDGRTFRVEGGNTPEEAFEAVARSQAFKRDSSLLGWVLGSAVTLLACVFAGGRFGGAPRRAGACPRSARLR